jgi:hypothetical protein
VSDPDGLRRRLVRIALAGSAFEAGLIRRGLEAAGIPCLIPGEDIEPDPGAGLEENAILVPVDLRDAALDVLMKVWEFFEPVDPDPGRSSS